MPNPEQRRAEVAAALDALHLMQRDGTLPPVLQPLLQIAPRQGYHAIVDFIDVDVTAATATTERRVQLRIEANDEVGEHEAGFDPMRDLLAALAEAEANPQLSFVALKFLRDRLLPQRGRVWSRAPQLCQRTIAEAIDAGAIITTKKPNPRNPEFPVTAVELQREHALVAPLLTEDSGAARPAKGLAQAPSSTSGAGRPSRSALASGE